MSNCDLKKILSIMTILVVLKIPTTISNVTGNEMFNSEEYRAFLNHFLTTSKRNQRMQETENKMVKEQKYNESPYERVIRNLRTDWETPMTYLQERGYFKNVDSKMSNDLSIDANNLINGPVLNPSTFKNLYNFPSVPNSILSDRNDRDCNYPRMYNDLECFDQYFGENMGKSIKDKWNSWFHKNQSTTTTTTTSTTTTTNPPTTSTTTPYPIANKTTEVISDLSLQDARDGLEFFKIYNDFMLTKLASKLSQDAHERQMFKSAQNEKENVDQNILPPILQNPTQAPLVPDFSRINENDIRVLKELDLCLKNKKGSSNLEDGTMNDVRNDNRVNDTYLPMKLKFLAHLHHEVVDFGQNKPLSKPTVNQSGCNVGITKLGATNGI